MSYDKIQEPHRMWFHVSLLSSNLWWLSLFCVFMTLKPLQCIGQFFLVCPAHQVCVMLSICWNKIFSFARILQKEYSLSASYQELSVPTFLITWTINEDDYWKPFCKEVLDKHIQRSYIKHTPYLAICWIYW